MVLATVTVRALGFAMLLSQGLGAMLAYAAAQGQDCNTIAVRPRYASGLVLVGNVYVGYKCSMVLVSKPLITAGAQYW